MILCCGDALIDMIPVTAEDGSQAFQPHCGGAVFNTAIALGRLGVPVGMVTGLSTDLFGQQLGHALRTSSVDTSLAITSNRPTTLAFVRLDHGQAHYTFYDEHSAGRMLGMADLPPLPQQADALYFGGISLCNPPAADAYVALAQHAASDRVIMLDPNIRPGFISDVPAYRARLRAMLAVADIVKVSEEDLTWIYPDAADDRTRLHPILDAGPALVILTKGREGACAYHRDGREVRVAAAVATVVDTVGAGDTFNAGLLAKAWERNLLTKLRLAAISQDDLRALLGFGADVAGVTVARAGANPPWRNELDGC